MDKFILHLKPLTKEKCGTKAKTLLTLKENSIKTPRAWIVSSEQYFDFVKHFNLPTFCEFISMERYTPKYQEFIRTLENSKEIELDIEPACRLPEILIARSSSEIGKCDKNRYASFVSGAFESYKCTQKTLKAAILNVYASVYSEVAYNQITLFNNNEMVSSMAVLVQEYIVPVCSGLAHIYTDNKITKLCWKLGHLRDIVTSKSLGYNDELFLNERGETIMRGNELHLYLIQNNNLNFAFESLHQICEKIKMLFPANLELEWIYDGSAITIVQCQNLLV